MAVECGSDVELISKDGKKRLNEGPGFPDTPKDRFHLVYLSLVLVGSGFLFPWNSYVAAIDYFQFLYPERHPAVAIPIVYLLTTFLSVSVTAVCVRHIPLHARLGFGYLLFGASLLLVPLLDVGVHDCTVPTSLSFPLTLLSVAMVGVGGGTQQASYYGLSSMLSGRHTQAVMVGESVAGVVVSLNRVVTKAAIASERLGSIAFFALSLGFVLVCVGCQVFLRFSPFVRYHTQKCDMFKAAVRMKSCRSDDHEDQEVLMESCGEVAEEKQTISRRAKFTLKANLEVARQIWALLVAIMSCYLVTLLLFPAVVAEVQHCPIGSWAPVILITLFNLTDFLAKWAAFVPLQWSQRGLMWGSLCRLPLVPLLLLCVSPSPSHPALPLPLAWACVFVLILGFTNGYFGCLPMVKAAGFVQASHRELAGTVMTWFLLSGLTTGAILAYATLPLTRLTEFQPCSNITQEFLCRNATTV